MNKPFQAINGALTRLIKPYN